MGWKEGGSEGGREERREGGEGKRRHGASRLQDARESRPAKI